MRYFALTLFAGGLALAACAEPGPTESSRPSLTKAGADHAAAAASHRYRVTLENLTSGQVFSPGVAATHTKDASVWASGAAASEGIRLIAEEGLETAAVAELSGAPGIFDVVDIASPTNRVGGGAPLPNPQIFEITAAANANRLSLAVMLICTNDGFAGLSGVKLPGGFRPDVHEVGAWDAGTEQNNEQVDQIVDPCTAAGPVSHPPDGNGRVATSGVILPHSNIQGVGDLSVALHGWSFPVARITVQRIN
ncbi:MAG: spondin domain-containing protein [Gemmatimonadales bacterium]|nr:spondin domain-containing protein [Gemmatimonadales bacterium]